MALNFAARSDASATRAYYLRSDEMLPGAKPVLVGKGWERLGITAFSEAMFRAVTEGRHPVTGKPLTQRFSGKRIDGWDATVNDPKSVSLAIEFSPDGERLRQSGMDALKETFEKLIEPSARVRYRDADGKAQSRFTGEMLGIIFPHGLARPQDGRDPMPHSHRHLYIVNWTFDPVRQKGYALNTLDLQKHLPSVESDYHRRSRKKAEAQGYRTKDHGRFWEIDGIKRSTIEKYSERRSAITKLLETKERVTGRLRDAVGLMTRSEKQHVEPESLREVWESRLTDAERRTFCLLKAKPKIGRPPQPRRSRAKHLDFVIRTATLAAERVQEMAHEYR